MLCDKSQSSPTLRPIAIWNSWSRTAFFLLVLYLFNPNPVWAARDTFSDTFSNKASKKYSIKANQLNETAVQKMSVSDLSGAESDLLKALVYSNNHPTISRNLSGVYYEKAVALMDAGRLIEALQYIKRSLNVKPDDEQYIRLHGVCLFKIAEKKGLEGKIADALNYYQKAVLVDDQSLVGWLKAANYAWTVQEVILGRYFFDQAARLGPKNEQVAIMQQRIENMEKEITLSSLQSEHFKILFHEGERKKYLDKDLLSLLERMYRDVAYRLSMSLPVTLTVIFYSEDDFHSSYGLPSHVIGLYDGKIRLPFPHKSDESGKIEGIIKHELAHAFLFWRTQQSLSPWLNEGIAQWVEKRSLGASLRDFLADYEFWLNTPSLFELNHFIKNKNRWAYLKAYSVVTYMISEYGIERVLDLVAQSAGKTSQIDSLMKQSLGVNLSELEYFWKLRLLDESSLES